MPWQRISSSQDRLCGCTALLARVGVASLFASCILAAAIAAAPSGGKAQAAAEPAPHSGPDRRLAAPAGWRAWQPEQAVKASPAGARAATLRRWALLRWADPVASDGGAKAIEDARQALVRAGRVPWYDPQHDTLRRLSVVPTPPPSRAASMPVQPPPNRTTASSPRWLGPLLQGVGLCLLAVVLVLVAVALVGAFLKQEQQETTARKVIATRREADRVASLPLPLDAAPADLLAEARRLAAEGRFSEAIVYLFSYQLLVLDEHRVLRLARGKTNRQYLRELRDQPALAAILERTMQTFEAAFFGRKVIPGATFAACWQDLDAFHTELSQLHPVAA